MDKPIKLYLGDLSPAIFKAATDAGHSPSVECRRRLRDSLARDPVVSESTREPVVSKILIEDSDGRFVEKSIERAESWVGAKLATLPLGICKVVNGVKVVRVIALLLIACTGCAGTKVTVHNLLDNPSVTIERIHDADIHTQNFRKRSQEQDCYRWWTYRSRTDQRV